MTATDGVRRSWRPLLTRPARRLSLFPPHRGDGSRNRAWSGTSVRDAFGKIVELGTAKQSGDTGAEAVPPGWRLAIVEADLQGTVAR